MLDLTVADPGGSRRHPPPPLFSAITLKSPLNWLKFTKHNFFQILDPPLFNLYVIVKFEQATALRST